MVPSLPPVTALDRVLSISEEMAASSFSLANSIHSKLCRFKTLIKPLQPATRHFPSITEIEAISVSSSSLTECSKSDVPPVRLITFIRFPPVAIASLSFWAIRTNSILIMKIKIWHTVVQFHFESDDNWLVRHSCKKIIFENFRYLTQNILRGIWPIFKLIRFSKSVQEGRSYGS